MIEKLKKAKEYFHFLERIAKIDFKDGEWVTLEGVHSYTFDNLNGSGCLVPQGDNTLVFFKGSDDMMDFVMDAMMFMGKYYVEGVVVVVVGKAHAGFLASWAILRREAFKAVERLDPHKEKVYTVVGHSLGAAMALMMADDLKTMGYMVEEVYTAGSPRVGDSRFVAWLKSRLRIVRIVNNYDLVPVLITGWFGWYKHVGTSVFLRDLYSVDSGAYRWNPLGYFRSGIKDHLISSYVSSLKGILKNREAF